MLENLCRRAIFQFFTKPDDVLAENAMQLFSQSKDHMDCTENKMLSFYSLLTLYSFENIFKVLAVMATVRVWKT